MKSAQVCLQDLAALSTEQDATKRRELLRKVTDLFFFTEQQQSDEDRGVFGGVMERVAFQLETEARAELADRLSSTRFAPHNIVRRLAEDEIDVARPVLERSTVLSDTDLVDIAYSKGQGHLLAMTRREALSAAVTDVIVQRGNDEVLTSVSGNAGAKFSSKSFEAMAMKATEVAELRANLVERDDIPNEIVETIKRNVAEKLKREYAEQDSEFTSGEIDHVVELQSEKVDFTAIKDDFRFGKLTIDVNDLHKKGLLTPGKISEFCEKSMQPELVTSLALKADVSNDIAYHTLYEAEVPALAVLCRACHFSRELFASLLQERVHRKDLPNDIVVSALKRYDALDDETAQRIFRFLKVRLSVAVKK